MTVNDNIYDGSGINIDTLFHYHNRGFIITPLGDDRQTSRTTPIYNNPDYWTPEKIRENLHLFKHVATIFGKSIKETLSRVKRSLLDNEPNVLR